jgi:photosystem II stability/assembly factor-like uncharacterized protein
MVPTTASPSAARMALALAAMLAAPALSARADQARAQALVAEPPKLEKNVNSDTPIWRATHRLLLGIARAGTRLVAVGNAGVVLLSDDEGKSWRQAKTPTDELLTAVVFPTPREGWAVGQDELVLHSTDAGETWTQLHMTPNADQTLFTIISIAPNHLFASGAYNLILETQDGAAWKESKIDNLDDDYHLNCAVARGDDLLVTGESGHAFVRYAGAWTQMKLPYDGSQFACLVGPGGAFYSFGLRGSAFRSLAGSATWTRLDLGTDASFFGAANLSSGMMALVGSNGSIRLLDPTTGKATVLPPVSEATLSAVVEGQGGKLIAVGADGVHLIDPATAAATAGAGQ